MNNEHVNKTIRDAILDAFPTLLVIRAYQSAPIPTGESFAAVFVQDHGTEGWDDVRTSPNGADLTETLTGRRRFTVQVDFYRQYTLDPRDYAEQFRAYLQTVDGVALLSEGSLGLISMPTILDLTDAESAKMEQRARLTIEVYGSEENTRTVTAIDAVQIFGNVDDIQISSELLTWLGFKYRLPFKVNLPYGVMSIPQVWPVRITLPFPAYFSDGRDIKIRSLASRQLLPTTVGTYDEVTGDVVLFFYGLGSQLFRGEVCWYNPDAEADDPTDVWEQSDYDQSCFAQPPFLFTVDTTKTGTGASNSDQYKLMLETNGTYDFLVDWGDTSMDRIQDPTDPAVTHTYETPGVYQISIIGQLLGWSSHATYGVSDDEVKLISIEQWGIVQPSESQGFFMSGCSNLAAITATDLLSTGHVTSAEAFFKDCAKLATIPRITEWDTSNIFYWVRFFANMTVFDQDLSDMDVSAASNIQQLFDYCAAFNNGGSDGINTWDTQNVIVASATFRGCNVFNQPLNNWNMLKCVSLASFLSQCRAFNNPVFMVSNALTNLSFTFSATWVFNDSSIIDWPVENVTDASNCFNSSGFNQPINWHLASCANASQMFRDAPVFNQDVSSFGMESCINIGAMFWAAAAFNNGGNDTLHLWNLPAAGVSADRFLLNARAFDQHLPTAKYLSALQLCAGGTSSGTGAMTKDVDNIDVSESTASCRLMLAYQTFFKHDVATLNPAHPSVNLTEFFTGSNINDTNTTTNYDDTLNAWVLKALRNSASFSGGNSKYSSLAKPARDYFTGTKLWTITDGGNADNFTASSASGKLQLVNTHDIPTYARIQLVTGSGVLPGGTAELTDYWLVRTAVNTFRLATSLANALAGTTMSWVSNGTAHATRYINIQAFVVTATSDSGKLLLTGNYDLPTGRKVRFVTSSALPTGLLAGTDYWLIRTSATAYRVATSLADAQAGTAIDYTDAGTGNHEMLPQAVI